MSLGKIGMSAVNIFNAHRPWLADESYRDEHGGRRFVGPETDPDEIEMCLNCPFAACEGNMRKCSHYRYHYLARVRKKNGNHV